MPSRNNPIERDPAFGRPIMKDIVSRAPRPIFSKITARKQVKAIEIPAHKKESAERRKFKLPKIKNTLIILGAIALSASLFILIRSLSEVLVSVMPRQVFSEVDSSLEASSNSAATLSLELISAEDTIELEGNVEKVSLSNEKANGRIVIFNAYSTQPQILVALTRFEAPGGKIYRIQNTVTVPGGKIEAGKLVPGQLEATVYADQTGPEYNLGLSDFTIPGFKGTPKFEKFYARSKTEISGGFSGGVRIVTKEVINSLLARAQSDFRASIRSKIQKDLPEGIFIPEGAIDVKVTLLSTEPGVNSTADKVRIRAKAVAEVAALKASDISRALASKYLKLKGGESVAIRNLNGLNFQIIGKNLVEKKLTFRITGRAQFVWLFDETSLKKDLLGASRQARKDVFKNYPGIDRAEIIFKPSWFRFFPSNPAKIKLDYLYNSA